MTQSPTREAEDREPASDSSFRFPRFVFFAAFAAAFFLRLPIAALLAMDHGGYAQHASGIDTRYIPFTTARRKNQRYCLTKRVRMREVTRCGAVKRAIRS